MEKSSLVWFMVKRLKSDLGRQSASSKIGSGVLRWSRYWKSLWRAGVIVDIERPLDIGTLLTSGDAP